MKKNLLQKRIPNLLVFLLLITAVGLTSILTGNTAIFLTRASLSNTPQDIKITNIIPASFTVSYKTSDKVAGALSFGIDKEMQETTQEASSHNIHYFTARNLKPQTLYYFSITSGFDTFLNNGSPFEVTTSSVLETPSESSKLSGSVILADGSKPQEGIVYFASQNSQTLSTVIKKDGTYLLDLTPLRSKDLRSYFIISPDDLLNLNITSGLLESNITILGNQINPIPIITLSQNYDFTLSNSGIEENIASNSAQFPNFSSPKTSDIIPQIIAPKKDEEFIDQKPLFKGTASPSANVDIIIQSDQEMKTQITADRNGLWSFRPAIELSPGNHTISIQTYDNFGILKKLTRSFTVYASGTQVDESATPSATPIFIPSPTPTPTLNPPTPTLTPTPVVIPSPTPTQSLIQAPGNTSFIPVSIIALATTAFGIITFIITKGL